MGAAMTETRSIWCCGCQSDVDARLTNGAEIYPHRPDLAGLPFWKCDTCGNCVGCHHKTRNRTRPLGVIATKEIKNARRHIHGILDPLWLSGWFTRIDVYARLAAVVGREEYHTADIRSVEEARTVYRAVQQMAGECARRMQEERG
jgi:hypothetical protein